MNIDVITSTADSVVIKLDENSTPLIVNNDGSIDKLTARCLASKVMEVSGIDHSKLDFLLEAFVGGDECLLFASCRKETCSHIFCFDSITNVALCSSLLSDTLEAVLYLLDKNFYLYIPQCGESEYNIISEFGIPLNGKDEVLCSLSSNGKILLNHDTIKELKKMA